MGAVTLIKGAAGKIVVTFPYIPDFVAKIKSIPGHRWHPDGKSRYAVIASLDRVSGAGKPRAWHRREAMPPISRCTG
jgi:hypothetical protein